MEIKSLYHGGIVTQTKETQRNGVPVGIVEGYAATWDVDRGGWDGVRDKFLPGAFTKSIERHKASNRQIRFKDHHNRTIGGAPIDTVKEDSRGVFVAGEINLDVQQGREAFALAKQGVLSDFSVGWSLGNGSKVVDKIREIPEAEIWEFSIVDEPMNPFANITAIKAIDYASLDFEDMKALEDALKNGIKFSVRTARKLISVMKAAGMLCDEQSGDDVDLLSDEQGKKAVLQKLDEILTTFKE